MSKNKTAKKRQYKVKVTNLKVYTPHKAWDVKVDRSSPLGNPYHLSSEEDRDKVIDDYRSWFYNSHHSQTFWNEIKRLEDILKAHKKIRLFCHCHPLKCHGEIIKEYLLDSAEDWR